MTLNGVEHQLRYGRRHRELRRAVAGRVAAGLVLCARCGQAIAPDDEWDLGHVDGDPSRYSGPEHRACNRQTATHAAMLRQRRTSRDW